MRTHTVYLDEYKLECTYSPGRAAQLYGLPENCYPEEPAEIEIISGSIGMTTLGDLSLERLADDRSFYERLIEEIEGLLLGEYEAAMESEAEYKRELQENGH